MGSAKNVHARQRRAAKAALIGVERARVAAANDRGVDVPLEQGLGHLHHLARQHNHGSGAVAHLLVLRSA